MEENLDDTVVVRRPTTLERPDLDTSDIEDTVLAGVPRASRTSGDPPALVEPPPRDARPSGSAYHLQPPTSATSPDSATPQAGAAPPRPTREEPPRKQSGFYRFRLTDKVVSLDAVAFVGRKPSNPRIASGRMPRLVRVASPAREVSGTHVELRQAGDTVVVTDLRSTNGTVVTIPRRKPRKLRQGESVVVTPGTLVDIGDGNVIEILPMQEEHQ